MKRQPWFQVAVAAGLGALLVCAAPAGQPDVPAAGEAADASTSAVTNLPVGGTLVLSIDRCLELALGGNIEIELARREPMRAGEDFFIAGESFVPVFSLEGAYGERESRTANTQSGASILEEEESVVAGRLGKRWQTGTRTDLVWAYSKREDNSEFRTLNPAHESSVGIEVIQPLLKDFGRGVNRTAIARTLQRRVIADREFDLALESELLSVYRDYWTLVRVATDLDLQEASLVLAEDQLVLASNQWSAGVVPELEVTTAEAAVARQSEAVIRARNLYRKRSDLLLYKIAPSTDAFRRNLGILPSSSPATTNVVVDIPALGNAITVALKHRPELELESAQIALADIDVTEAVNARRPQLDLFGRYGFNGLAASVGDSLDDISNTEFPEWRVGVSLEFLFDSRSRKARWRKAVLAYEDAEIRARRAAALIALEVRAAVFDLEAASERLAAAERSLVLAREQYEGEADRLSVGRSTVFRVDAFRRDLLQAERNRLDAAVDIFVAKAVMQAAQGVFTDTVVRGPGD